jgi:Holliday junction resolvase RusA-like endonuclease
MTATATTVRLVIPGRPVPLQRSRTRAGKHYLPPRSRAYRELVQAAWLEAGRPTVGAEPFTLSARFYGARANADLDNLVKAVLDALNGLAFADDAQLMSIMGAHKVKDHESLARTVVDLRSLQAGWHPEALSRERALAQLRREPDDDQPVPWRPAA